MSQITDDPKVLALCAEGETAWERDDETVYLQRACTAEGCDRGLVYGVPGVGVIFCPACHGDGMVTRIATLQEAG